MTFEGTQALINSLVDAGLLVPRFMGEGERWYSIGNRVLSTDDVRVGWIEGMRTALADAQRERDEWKAKYEDLIVRDRRLLEFPTHVEGTQCQYWYQNGEKDCLHEWSTKPNMWCPPCVALCASLAEVYPS